MQPIVLAKPVGIPTIHYALAIQESYTYKLLCNGKVVDALGCSGDSSQPTCKHCQAMDKPLDAETAARTLGEMLGYEGRAGGWVYKDGKAICQGWNAFARKSLGRFAAEGYLVPTFLSNGAKRFQVVVGAL